MGKESACSAGDTGDVGSIPGSGRSAGGGNGYPHQYSWGFPSGSDGKESPCNARTQVRSLGREDPLEEGMATHSSILAWRIPWTEEPSRLQSIGLHRVRHK